MRQVYQQLFFDEDCKHLVVINTYRGLFRYNRLPIGISISSALGIFQRAMEMLLQDVPNVKVYLDDILITGSTEEAHLQTLETVLDCLWKAGLRLPMQKCILMVPSVVYLGHTIYEQGPHPTDVKVRAVQEAPGLNNLPELKSYLGLLSLVYPSLQNVYSSLQG